MRKQHLPLQRLMSHESLLAIATELRYADIDALYAAIGESHVSAQSVVAKLVQSLGGEEGASEDLAEATLPSRVSRRPRSGDPGVVVKGVDDLWVKLARCCTPVPGDPIIGFVTRGSGVSVHRADCTNVAGLLAEPDRIVEVEWAPSSATVFLVQIQVEALDRSRLAVRRHPGAVRRARQHPVGDVSRRPGTGWPSRGSRSRWATRAISVMCSTRCGASTGSSTPTGSPEDAPRLRRVTARNTTFLRTSPRRGCPVRRRSPRAPDGPARATARGPRARPASSADL